MARSAATTRKVAGAKAAPSARGASGVVEAKAPAVRGPAKVPVKAGSKGLAKGLVRPLKLDGLSPEDKVARLLEDREALVAHIAGLEAEVKRQQDARAAVADRVAWALDSLRDLID